MLHSMTRIPLTIDCISCFDTVMSSALSVVAATIAIVTATIYLARAAPIFCTDADHQSRLDQVISSIESRPPGSKLSLHRRTLQSNTIRNASHKLTPSCFPVDLSSFRHIIRIDRDGGYVICEPGVGFGDLVRRLVKVGMTTLVVPELPGITVGGAISGGSLESSSHRYGQLSDTVLEIECLTPELRVCSPTSDPDLFYAISASYNTVALITNVKLMIKPAPRYVSLTAKRFHSFPASVAALQDTQSDIIEGIAYAPDEILVVAGYHTSSPSVTARTFSRHWDRWYYKSIRTTPEMTVPYIDYCFRYNYGSFWMAEYVLDMLGGDNIITRFLIGGLLDTSHLFAVLHSGNMSDLGRMRVIQDCYVPVDKAARFLETLNSEIGVYPLWLCPIKATTTNQVLASHYSPTPGMFINVGIYGRPRQFPFDAPKLHSRLIDLLIEMGGRSMLYAQTWHTRDQFDSVYGDAIEHVEQVKGALRESFFGLYEKVALSNPERMQLGKPMTGTEAAETRKVVVEIFRQKLHLGG